MWVLDVGSEEFNFLLTNMCFVKEEALLDSRWTNLAFSN